MYITTHPSIEIVLPLHKGSFGTSQTNSRLQHRDKTNSSLKLAPSSGCSHLKLSMRIIQSPPTLNAPTIIAPNAIVTGLAVVTGLTANTVLGVVTSATGPASNTIVVAVSIGHRDESEVC